MSNRTIIEDTYYEIARACDAHPGGLHRLLREAFHVACDQERAHRRAFGRKAVPVVLAAKFFIVRAVLTPLPPPATWRDAMAVRHDIALASAIGEALQLKSEHTTTINNMEYPTL